MREHKAYQEPGHPSNGSAVFRKIGVVYVPSSIHGWLLLSATAWMFLQIWQDPGHGALPAVVVGLISLPPLFLYYWIARHCCGDVHRFPTHS